MLSKKSKHLMISIPLTFQMMPQALLPREGFASLYQISKPMGFRRAALAVLFTSMAITRELVFINTLNCAVLVFTGP